MVRCTECNCIGELCVRVKANSCGYCTKRICCCLGVHRPERIQSFRIFLRNMRSYFPAALGIEILCISAAVIGENTAFYIFGYGLQGIFMGYVIGYGAAGFTTFVTILGRYNGKNSKVDSCCSVLEQHSCDGFLPNLVSTLGNFTFGLSSLFKFHNQSELGAIIKTSVIILFTAESACILTAETIDLIFYNSSVFLSIPLALLTGAFTVVAPEAYKRTKRMHG